jgi:hypothetical protein
LANSGLIYGVDGRSTIPDEGLSMRLLAATAFAALLLGTTVSMSAFADTAASTGCGSDAQRAESEGGGGGSAGNVTRKAEAEGGGVGSVGNVTRKAEAEGGGVGSVDNVTRKTEAEGGGGTVGNVTSRQMAAAALPCK